MSNKKKSMSKQEFIQRYREADPATQYALEQSVAHFFVGKNKDKCNKEGLAAYWNERIGEYNAYSKASNTVNIEYAMAHVYIDRADAILTAALECDGGNVGVNTIYSLLWVIKDILKSSNISATALHRFIPQPASGRSSALPCLAANIVLSKLLWEIHLHSLKFIPSLTTSGWVIAVYRLVKD